MSISVTRTTVVRAHHELDATSCQQLDRIVTDLIDNQGHTDLIVDLSQARHIDHSLRAVPERAQTRTDALGGTLEIRTPPEPTGELLRSLQEEELELAATMWGCGAMTRQLDTIAQDMALEILVEEISS
jgi:anti-anti-sigma regulatory factor